ncbi:hypothetical protein [Marinobacterium arenosum]|uniref:hypothetical protein n=1 Tax=Marinobacterium arenosum TaxID=2862496 RepID=UPI001C96B550|nr:hypothetical protein [Marinobacterium arenosum]MBY4675109.1 hypothetical protein [Marinobacterium arenosum]
MFSNRPTKAQLRHEHEQQIKEFLAHGGKIQQVKMGATGLVDGKYNTRNIQINPAKQQRTPIPEVVAAIDSRRGSRSKNRPKPVTSRHHQRRQKVIYDDFGEPLRTVWVDE